MTMQMVIVGHTGGALTQGLFGTAAAAATATGS